MKVFQITKTVCELELDFIQIQLDNYLQKTYCYLLVMLLVLYEVPAMESVNQLDGLGMAWKCAGGAGINYGTFSQTDVYGTYRGRARGNGCQRSFSFKNWKITSRTGSKYSIPIRFQVYEFISQTNTLYIG